MSRVNTILISGYYGFDNSGDDAILKAIVKDIKQYNSEVSIAVLSNNPSKTEKMYCVKAVNRFKFKEVLKEMKNTDLFISGGGSLLQDITSTRSLLYYLTLMKLAKIFKKPVMVYANGIGPINKKINRFLARKILNKVDLITLRDEDSKAYVKGLGVRNKNIHVTADPVFTLAPDPKDSIDRILKKEGIPMNKKMIGISVRQWKKANNLTEVVSKAIDYIIKEHDVNVILIPMHYPEDLEISEEIIKKVNSNDCYLLSDKYSVEEIMGVIKELEIIVAMRLHSLIYAATQGIPMVGLVYDPKIEGILRSLKMDHMCSVEDLIYEELISNIDYVWNNRLELKETLRKLDKDLQDKALSNVTMALDLLEVGD